MNLHEIHLSENEKLSLREIKNRLTTEFPVEELVIFGSTARNEATPESDLDLLIITSQPLSHRHKHLISDVVCGINLIHETNISILIVDRKSWDYEFWSVLPLKQEVLRDGVAL
jgi:predicted nucleotidyltransferase